MIIERPEGLYSKQNRPRACLSKLYRPWYVRNINEHEFLSRKLIKRWHWFSKKVTVYEVDKVRMVGKRVNGAGFIYWVETYYTGREWVFTSRRYANKFIKGSSQKEYYE